MALWQGGPALPPLSCPSSRPPCQCECECKRVWCVCCGLRWRAVCCVSPQRGAAVEAGVSGGAGRVVGRRWKMGGSRYIWNEMQGSHSTAIKEAFVCLAQSASVPEMNFRFFSLIFFFFFWIEDEKQRKEEKCASAFNRMQISFNFHKGHYCLPA